MNRAYTPVNRQLETLIEAHLSEIASLGKPESFVRHRRLKLVPFVAFLNEQNLYFDEIGIREAQEYQGWLTDKGRDDGEGYAANTIRDFIAQVSAFYKALEESGYTAGNPFADIQRVPFERKVLRHVYSREDMAALLEHIKHRWMRETNLKNKVRDFRLHVLAELLYASGMRIAEAANLKLSDIDFETGRARIRQGKGGRERHCVLSSYSLSVLRIYIEKVRPLSTSAWHNEELLFGTGEDRFKKWAQTEFTALGIEASKKPIKPHGFRHAVGFHLLKSGCPLRSIQDILGHEKIRSTEIYTKVDREDLKELLDQFHPRKLEMV